MKCLVSSCNNRTDFRLSAAHKRRNSHVKLTFHSLPKNLKCFNLWLDLLGITSSVPKHARICSEHFAEECFDRSGSIVRLRPNALPHKVLPRSSSTSTSLEPSSSLEPLSSVLNTEIMVSPCPLPLKESKGTITSPISTPAKEDKETMVSNLEITSEDGHSEELNSGNKEDASGNVEAESPENAGQYTESMQSSSVCTKPKPGKRRRNSNTDPIIAEAFKYLQTVAEPSPKTECDHFTDYVNAKLKSFDNRHRILAQNRIQNVLCDIEMSILDNPSNISTSDNIPRILEYIINPFQ